MVLQGSANNSWGRFENYRDILETQANGFELTGSDDRPRNASAATREGRRSGRIITRKALASHDSSTDSLPRRPHSCRSPRSPSAQRAATQKAFPTAEGFGAYAKGGRGGAVLFVENLNDAGPGSLRAAVEDEGPAHRRLPRLRHDPPREGARRPRAVHHHRRPDRAGRRDLPGRLRAVHRDARRHRPLPPLSAPATAGPASATAITVRECDNVIVDHCSASWAVDEVLSTTKSKNVTVQWCMITEALHDAGHHKGNHGFGGLDPVRGRDRTTTTSSPTTARATRARRAGSSTSATTSIYDWNAMAGYAEGNKQRLNYVANYLKPGPSTHERPRTFAFHTGKEEDVRPFPGNVFEGLVAPGEDDRKVINVRNGGNVVDRPHEVPPVMTQPAIEARDCVLAEAGATLPKRDAVDRARRRAGPAGHGPADQHAR